MKWRELAILSTTIIFLLFGIWWVSQASDEILLALRIVLYAATGIIIMFVLVLGILFAGQRWAETRKTLAEARQVERKAQHTVIVANGDQQVFIADKDHSVQWRAAHRDPRVYGDGEWTEPETAQVAAYLAWLQSRQPSRHIAQSPEEWQIAGPIDLLTEISNFERLLIVGNSGSGKTTLLQHMIIQQQGDVIIIDPHDDTHTWPANCQIVGGGQDYDSIERALLELAAIVQERYQERAQGTLPEFDPLTVCFEEWRELIANVPTATDSMKTLLTGGRKINTGLALLSHSDRVGPLGIKGEGDLKDGFYVVRLKGDKRQGITATLDKGDGQIPIRLPGPYRPGRAMIVDPGRAQLPMTEQEKQILSLYADEVPVSSIGARVYGQRGGWQSERVEEVLKKFGKI